MIDISSKENFSHHLKDLLKLFVENKHENKTWEGKMTALLSKLSISYEQIEQSLYGRTKRNNGKNSRRYDDLYDDIEVEKETLAPNVEFRPYMKKLLELFIRRKQETKNWEAEMTPLLSKLSFSYEKVEQDMYEEPEMTSYDYSTDYNNNITYETTERIDIKTESIDAAVSDEDEFSITDKYNDIASNLVNDEDNSFEYEEYKPEQEISRTFVYEGYESPKEASETFVKVEPKEVEKKVIKKRAAEKKPRNKSKTEKKVVAKKIIEKKQDVTQKYECEPCDMRFNNTSALSKHMTRKHHVGDRKRPKNEPTEDEDERVQCSYCNIYMKSAALAVHVASKHASESLKAKYENKKCTECDYTNERATRVDKHYRTVHEGVRDHQCSRCEFSTDSSSYLKKHVNFHHEDKYDHRCKYCMYCAITDAKLRKHVFAVHDAIKDEKCPHCPQSFSTRYNADLHVKTVHENFKAFYCDKCGYGTNKRKNLEKHQSQNSRISKFRCGG